MTVRPDPWRGVIAIAMAAWMGAACGLRSSSTFVERGFDINRYRTYAWAAEVPQPIGDPRLDDNRFLTARLHASIDRELIARGLALAPGAADLAVRYHVSVMPRIESTGVRDVSGIRRNSGASAYEAGTLLIDLVDAPTGRLVWRGWVEGAVDGIAANQAWLDETVDRAVVKVFEPLAARQ